MKKDYFLLFLGAFFFQSFGQTVSSLVDFKTAMHNSNQDTVLESGEYYLDDLLSGSRVIDCSGSNNVI